MAEFVYNNAINSKTGQTPFKLNYGYDPCISFEENIDPCSWLKMAKKLFSKQSELMTVYWENLYYAQEL